ncbi:MAG: DedA family protein [Chloroflexota bacterium]|nr:MAG: DedA family protein [Chloroflexota bacterium]
MLPGVDLRQLLEAVGYFGLFAIVFAESGLLVGFFLPGDSLLFTAGLLAGLKFFDLWVLLPLVAVAAITGDSVGYAFGNRVGARLFQREDSFLFHRRNLVRAHAFYEKHGGKTIVLARFLPIVRTFAPIVAGMGQMTYGRFLMFNVLGGLLWTLSMVGGGYLFGSWLPAEQVDKFLLPAIALIIIASVAPTAWHLYKENRELVHAAARQRTLRPRLDRPGSD